MSSIQNNHQEATPSSSKLAEILLTLREEAVPANCLSGLKPELVLSHLYSTPSSHVLVNDNQFVENQLILILISCI